jgi:hypothetical protein
MIQAIPIAFGSLKGTRYDFLLQGDTLTLNVPGNDTPCISVISKGSFRATGGDLDLKVYAGNVLNWPDNKQYQITSLEPNSRLVNLIKG